MSMTIGAKMTNPCCAAGFSEVRAKTKSVCRVVKWIFRYTTAASKHTPNKFSDTCKVPLYTLVYIGRYLPMLSVFSNLRGGETGLVYFIDKLRKSVASH